MDASQLARLEMLCEVFNTTGDQAKRAQAQAELVAISSSPDSIPLCRDIMEHSQRPYALTFATRTLTDLVTRHWNNFTKEQGVDMRTCSRRATWVEDATALVLLAYARSGCAHVAASCLALLLWHAPRASGRCPLMRSPAP